MPEDETKEGQWFADFLQPHEPMLRAWLRSRFPDEGDIDDLVQESYLRVLRARKTTEIISAKAFLFATARNLALGKIRKQVTRGEFFLADLAGLAILDDNESVSETVAHSEELEYLTKAIQSLPARCRQIITLRKIYGLSQKDIATELGISVHTVESQGTIGMRKLADFFEQIDHRSEKQK